MLYVFEGPDGVGKSSISSAFAESLREHFQRPVRHWSFPGREKGTLGWAVYRLHHQPSELGVASLSSASLQALHIAAHIDSIESWILPALNAGEIVVLDRFWWSTLVYGIVGGVRSDVLQSLIEVERKAWGDLTAAAAFLVDRDRPFRLRDDERMDEWQRLKEEYRRLADRESRRHAVVRLRNEGTIEEAAAAAVAACRPQ